MDNYYITPNKSLINSSNTNYLALSFRRKYNNYNINDIGFKIDFSGGLFQLFNNAPKNITYLKKNVDYFFYTRIKIFNYIRFTLTMKSNSNITAIPFQNIESQNLREKYDYQKHRGYNQSISPIINGDKLIISISNNITDQYFYYINFKIRPLYNIDYMVASIDIVDYYIDNENYKYSKEIYSLKSHFKYYIKMNSKLNLKIYNVSHIPFSSMIIYECYYISYYSCKKISSKNKFKIQNNSYEISFEKKHNLDERLLLIFEIMPEYDINYMVAETEIIEYFKINTTALIFAIIEIIFLIIIIIYIVYLFRKCLKPKSKDFSLTDLAPNHENELISEN